MRSKRPLLFTVLGVLFVVAGIVTALGLITAWNVHNPIRGEFFGYAVLNFLLAYGFFNMQRWILPALALNWLAGAGIAAVKFFVHTPTQSSLVPYAVSFCVGGLIFLAVYILPRGKLSTSPYERTLGTSFVVIWAATACYTIVVLLT